MGLLFIIVYNSIFFVRETNHHFVFMPYWQYIQMLNETGLRFSMTPDGPFL